MISWLRYVPHDQIEAFLAKGWEIVDTLAATHHGDHAILMRWAGEGEP